MNRNTYSLLPRFLAISIALHTCLFLVFGHTLLMTPKLHLGQSVLEIHLHDAALLQKVASDLPRAEKSDNHARESIANSAPPISAVEAGPRALVSSTKAREGLYNQLLGVLRTRLSQYLTYPPLARSRGWEGTVLLSLRVEPDGQLDEVRLERSSGFAVLDDSALNSLKQFGYLAEARDWLQDRSFDMQLPVIYKLIEN